MRVSSTSSMPSSLCTIAHWDNCGGDIIHHDDEVGPVLHAAPQLRGEEEEEEVVEEEEVEGEESW